MGLAGPAGTVARASAASAPPAAARAQARPERPRDFRFGAPLGLPSLVSRSDTIVAGEVVDLRSSWTADRSDIFTTVVLRVDHRLKGSGGDSGADLIRFRVPGGAVGEDWVRVTHAPRFALGERALVFLRSGGGRLPTVVGMEAGKRHLATGDDGIERILPAFSWNRGAGRREVALATVEELAAAVPRLEAEAPARRRN